MRTELSAASAALLGVMCLGMPVYAAAAGADERLYVSDESGGNVVVVDPAAAKVIASVAVGRRPRGIVVSADGSRLYVALSGSAQWWAECGRVETAAARSALRRHRRG